MITVIIQDSTDSMEFYGNEIESPLVLTPQIAETDVETIDGNISTYYGSTKRQYSIRIPWMTAADYAQLQGFRDRQYSTLKYPQVSITGATNVNVTNMTAKLTLNAQSMIDQCGLVEGVEITLRESKQIV